MDLEECVLITDATLIHLAMGCPRLEKLVTIFFFSKTRVVLMVCVCARAHAFRIYTEEYVLLMYTIFNIFCI